MKNGRCSSMTRAAAALMVCAVGVLPVMAQPAAQPATQTAPPSAAGEKDPRAIALLQRMSDFLGRQKQFSVRAHSTSEVVTAGGQKLQFDATSQLEVQRPNHLHSRRVGEKSDLDFYYDGSSVTLYGHRHNYYASMSAPPTLDAMIDAVRARLDLEPPGADLFYADMAAGLLPDVTQALDVGAVMLDGKAAHHLAFRAKDVDWQIWIADGERPLPLKYVVTTTSVASAPQSTVVLSDWNLSPHLSASTFKFTPPRGAQKIDFLAKK